MRIESRVDGAQIMRPGTGRQRLLVASSHPAELLIVCRLEDVVSVVRHYDEELQKTVPCTCTGPCYSQRLDRFLAVLYRAGPTVWDERVLVLPAQGWFNLQSSALAKNLDVADIRGMRCILRRVGSSTSGRTQCTVEDRVKAIPDGFDLAAAIRNATGISADFFGDSDGAAFPQEMLPIKPRDDGAASHPLGKPHLPLGTQQKK